MIVVSDTSPILYLVSINRVELLPQLYEKIIIPDIVKAEMSATGAPAVLKKWISNPPDWLEIRAVLDGDISTLQRLHPGERAAILLAQKIKADLLLVDDKDAHQTAQSLGLKITGLLGILGEASKQNQLDLASTINQLLRETNFRASPRLIREILNQFS
jgi:predicted nucleic acid-binding protein